MALTIAIGLLDVDIFPGLPGRASLLSQLVRAFDVTPFVCLCGLQQRLIGLPGVCVRAQSCLTLCHPVNCGPPGFSVHEILQARILEWFVMPSSRASFQPIDCSMPGFPVHHQLPEPTQTQCIASVMPSNHLILCHPLPLLPSIFPSIRHWNDLK